MNASQVESAISKASRLMNEDYMSYLDDVSSITAGGNKGSGKRRKGGNDLAFLEQQAFGYSPSTPSYQSQQMMLQENPTPRQFSNGALRDSFAENPPMSGASFPGADKLGLGGYQPGASLLNEQKIAQQQFVQQPQYVHQPQYIPQQTGGIDYNTIKYLVSEAIKENLAEIKQSLLNESSLRGIHMPGGNKIQFFDSKGNVYEGQLIMKKKKQ